MLNYQQQVQEILALEKTETDQKVFVSLLNKWKETVSVDRVMEMTKLNDIAERWQDNICGILKEQNRKMYDTAACGWRLLAKYWNPEVLLGRRREC